MLISRMLTRIGRIAISVLPAIILILAPNSFGKALSAASPSPYVLDASTYHETAFQYVVPPKVGAASVSSSSLGFEPFLPLATFERSGMGIYNTYFDTIPFDMNVFLPDGARINQVIFSYIDYDDSQNIVLGFGRSGFEFNGELFAWTNTTGSDPNIRYSIITGITPETVDNGNFNYFIDVLLPPGSEQLLFLGVRIDYSYRTFTPVINK